MKEEELENRFLPESTEREEYAYNFEDVKKIVQAVEDENLESFASVIKEYIKVYIDYIKEHQEDDIGKNPSDEYVRGWIDGLDAMGTDLLGRKSEDALEKIRKEIE